MVKVVDVDEDVGAPRRFRPRDNEQFVVMLVESLIHDVDGDQIGFVWEKVNHLVWPEGRPTSGDSDKRPRYLQCRRDASCFGCKMAREKPRLVEPAKREKMQRSALVVLLARKTAGVDKNFQPIVRALPWTFGADKWRKLQPIIQNLEPKVGKYADIPAKVYPVDLLVTCPPKGETFQKLEVQVSTLHGGQLWTGAAQDKVARHAEIADAIKEARDEDLMSVEVVEPSVEEQQATLTRMCQDQDFPFGENAGTPEKAFSGEAKTPEQMAEQLGGDSEGTTCSDEDLLGLDKADDGGTPF